MKSDFRGSGCRNISYNRYNSNDNNTLSPTQLASTLLITPTTFDGRSIVGFNITIPTNNNSNNNNINNNNIIFNNNITTGLSGASSSVPTLSFSPNPIVGEHRPAQSVTIKRKMSTPSPSQLSPAAKTNGQMNGPSSSSDNGTAGSHEERQTDSTGSGEPIPGPLRMGKCKWFNVLKGIGFITPDDGTDDVFVHQSALKMPGFRSLDEGEPVEFASKKTERGWEATYVSGSSGEPLRGSRVHPLGKKRFQKIRCFNCGRYGNHTAQKCPKGPLAKSCYYCQSSDHLIADCPTRSTTDAAPGDGKPNVAVPNGQPPTTVQ